MKRVIGSLTVVLFCIIFLAACSPEADTSPASSGDAPEPTAEEALQPVTPAVDGDAESGDDGSGLQETVAEKPVLTFEQRGGLMGIGPGERVWQFHADGYVEVSDGRSWEMESTQIESLIDQVLAADFLSLDEDYVPEDTCCDRMTYVITLHAGGETHTVTTLDGAEMPQNLVDVLDALNGTVSDLAERP